MRERITTGRDGIPRHVTIRAAARIVGIGEHPLRAAVARGDVAIYCAPGTWPLVAVDDVVRWLRSHRAAPTDHARARVAEVLRREAEHEARRTG